MKMAYLKAWLSLESHVSKVIDSKHVLLIVILLSGTFACQTGNREQINGIEKSMERIFKSQGTTLSNQKAIRKVFDLDSLTKVRTSAARYFWDEVENRGLMFHLNNLTNSIYVYDFDKGSLLNVIKFSRVGPNGVGKVSGFEVVNRDSILVLDRYKYQVTIVGNILTEPKIESRHYLKSSIDATEYTAICNSSSRAYLIDGVLWFATVPFLYTSDNVHKKGVSLVRFDLKTSESAYFKLFPEEYNTIFSQSFRYPSIAKLNDKELAISFPASSKLLVMDTESQNIKKYDVPSKYVSEVREYRGGNDNDKENIHFNKHSSFSRLLFDKKENKLYRFFRTPNTKIAELYDWKAEASFYGVQVISEDMAVEKEIRRIAGSSSSPILMANDGLYMQDFMYIDSMGKPNQDKMSYLKLFLDEE